MTKSQNAFRTISEVSNVLDTPTHVLRFWESKFSQIKPVKRAGGRRYYRPDDIQLLAGIKTLLHDQGMTIKGAQKMLREQGVKHVMALRDVMDGQTPPKTSDTPEPIVVQSAPDILPEKATPSVEDVAVPEALVIAASPIAEPEDNVVTLAQDTAPVITPTVIHQRATILAQIAIAKRGHITENAQAIAPHLAQLTMLRDRIRQSL